jgi:hypothetical protein
VSAASLGLVLAVLAYLVKATTTLDDSLFTARMDWLLRGFQLFALIEVVGAAYAVWVAILAWRRREASILYRLAASLIALALVILAGLILAFHVLAPSLAY